MKWPRRSRTRAQTDAQKQAAWADRSLALGEGRGWKRVEPGFFQRLGMLFGSPEQRAITSLPWSTGGTLGSTVSMPSADSALALGAVYSAISLLARTVAGLPLHAYRESGGKKTELDQLPSLFDQPSVQGDLFDWLHRCITSLALYGNAYGLVTNRDGFGYPTGIEWLSPEHMTIVDFAFTGPGSFLDPIWRWRGRTIPKENLLHIPWFTRPWVVRGLSPLGAYAASVNTGLGAQKFSSDWFDAGGVPPGTFKNIAKTVPREEAQEVKNRLTESIRTHQAIVYGADWDYKPIAINPQEAQFIETMKLTATQVAAIYGVPPDRIGGEKSSSLTYSTVEQDSIDFVQFTILNYTRKLESAFFKILPTRQFVRFNLDALIRTDILTRHKVYMLDRQMGLRNVNEIRDLETLAPITGEDAAEANSYAPLIATGFAPDPNEAGMATSQPAGGAPADDSMQVVNLPPRKSYQDQKRTNGNGYRDLVPIPESPHTTINNYLNVPERQTIVEHHAGDVIVQPSPPAEVRIEQPLNIAGDTINVAPAAVSVPVQVDSPVTVNTPEIRVPINVQPASAPAVTVEAPITVNTPEVQVAAPNVTVEPAVINLAMPKADPPSDVEVLDGTGKVISRTRRVKK